MDKKLELDSVYSLYIRLRDAGDGGWTKCISCGKILPFEKMQCGHFYSRRHIATRWDEYNCNSECGICNCHETDHLLGYRENLLKKIGQAEFDRLSERYREESKEPEDWEYDILIKGYRDICRKLSREKGIRVTI